MTSGKMLSTLEGHSYGVKSVAYSPDGKFLASASWDTTIKIWEVASGTILSTLQGHWNGVTSVAYSPDGKFLASASWDTTIKIWDWKNRLPLAEYLAIAKFQRMEVVFSAPTSDNLYGTPGKSFFVSHHLALGILRSGLSEAEKNYRLAWLYLQGGSWESALLLWQQLPEGEEKERLKIQLRRDVCDLDATDCRRGKRVRQALLVGALRTLEWNALVKAYSALLCERDYSNAIQLLQESSAEAHNPYRYLLLLANLGRTGNKEQYQAVVRELEKETKNDDWGWQILAYYRGKVSLDTLQGQTEWDHERLPAFYFFVGLDFLSKKKTEEARSYLEKCLEAGDYLPWCKDLARIELEKLKKK